MCQRAVEGLSNLGGEIGRGIVGGSTALAPGRSELGLEKQGLSLDAFLFERLQGFNIE